jgi:hypothetical protein
MTQTGRILAALNRGPVSPKDFALPNVIDGGSPIMRVAARIHDLVEAGYEITSETAGDGTAVYQLGAPRQERTGATGSAPPRNDPARTWMPAAPVPLFDSPPPAGRPAGMFDEVA